MSEFLFDFSPYAHDRLKNIIANVYNTLFQVLLENKNNKNKYLSNLIDACMDNPVDLIVEQIPGVSKHSLNSGGIYFVRSTLGDKENYMVVKQFGSLQSFEKSMKIQNILSNLVPEYIGKILSTDKKELVQVYSYEGRTLNSFIRGYLGIKDDPFRFPFLDDNGFSGRFNTDLDSIIFSIDEYKKFAKKIKKNSKYLDEHLFSSVGKLDYYNYIRNSTFKSAKSLGILPSLDLFYRNIDDTLRAVYENSDQDWIHGDFHSNNIAITFNPCADYENLDKLAKIYTNIPEIKFIDVESFKKGFIEFDLVKLFYEGVYCSPDTLKDICDKSIFKKVNSVSPERFFLTGITWNLSLLLRQLDKNECYSTNRVLDKKRNIKYHESCDTSKLMYNIIRETFDFSKDLFSKKVKTEITDLLGFIDKKYSLMLSNNEFSDFNQEHSHKLYKEKIKIYSSIFFQHNKNIDNELITCCSLNKFCKTFVINLIGKYIQDYQANGSICFDLSQLKTLVDKHEGKIKKFEYVI